MAGNAVPMEKVAGGQPAQIIAGFCELMPGVPWTTQLVDEIFCDLQTSIDLVGDQAKEFSFVLDQVLSTDWHVEGYMKVTKEVTKARGARGAEALVVWLEVGNGTAYRDAFPDELVVKKQNFPNTREGLKHAIQHLQEAAQWLSRRGICTDCLNRKDWVGRDTPMKRIRLADHEVCGSCLVARAVAPHNRNAK